MTGHIYWDVILKQHVRLFRGAMGAEFLFMDDNACPHRANIVDECLQTEDITRMDWPAYSPDMNPIEHVLHPGQGPGLPTPSAGPVQTLPDTELLNLNSLNDVLDLSFGQKYSKDYALLQMKTRHQKPEESLQEYAFEIQRLTTLAFSDFSANVREMISLEYFVVALKGEEIQSAVRMVDFQDLKSALLHALKFEAATRASCIESHSIRRARVTADALCESLWRKEIRKLKEEIQDLVALRQNRRRRSITCRGCGKPGHLRSNCSRNNKEDRSTKCWGCGGAGHLRNNCSRVNQKDPHRASVIESKKACSHRKESADGNIDAPSRRSCPENSKYSLRVEKKFGVIDPVARQVATLSISESDPFSDERISGLILR
ncbi:uncharacterized protein TNCV_4424121 [Trichonephila clavipes]|nr:uncharacterized protein TNCV_4424121 [Trichonephila clavipes]